MPLRITTIERYPTADRNEFARAALQFCRESRVQSKIRMARYYWADTGNTIGIVVEGEPGCFDDDPQPDPDLLKAAFTLHDLGSRKLLETWGDAGPGERAWEQAGRPMGAR